MTPEIDELRRQAERLLRSALRERQPRRRKSVKIPPTTIKVVSDPWYCSCRSEHHSWHFVSCPSCGATAPGGKILLSTPFVGRSVYRLHHIIPKRSGMIAAYAEARVNDGVGFG